MPKGKVTKVFKDGGNGFILAEDGVELRVKFKDIQGGDKTLSVGEEVSFNIEQDSKGPKAVDVIRTIRDTPPPILPSKTLSPYKFCKRERRDQAKELKEVPDQFHDKLLPRHYDIAFEISWKTLTPTAVNPCTDTSANKCNPDSAEQKEYTGYNKRWLMIGNRLAISPFTVKSAIANGFANLLGGCYRVTNGTEAHRRLEQGQYPYTGRYKRYRVAMDKSKPGIIIRIDSADDGSRHIFIKPVSEFYFDSDRLPFLLMPGQKVYISKMRPRGNKPPIVEELSIINNPKYKEVIYYGSYSYGMNSSSVKGKPHKHRFYEEKGKEISGTIPTENFNELDELKDLVYMGRYKNEEKGEPWFENLSKVKAGDFIYYEEFNGKVTNIGKSFQFKAMFLHEDAVHEDYQECTDFKKLCPRCKMFGITGKTDNKDKDSIGLKGRFKSSALLGNEKWEKEVTKKASYSFIHGNQPELKSWIGLSDGKIAYQALLPISGAPKPNKRDIKNGYYNRNTGEIEGAKVYLHGSLESAENINDVNGKSEEEYTHRLRNYAQVCEKGLEFTGTVGAENCTIEEVAALVMLLHNPVANHGFKIGLGKAFGMGSVKSDIKRIWVRTTDYSWENIEPAPGQILEQEIEKLVAGFNKELTILKKVAQKVNSIIGRENKKLSYPSPVQLDDNRRNVYYWDKFNQQSG